MQKRDIFKINPTIPNQYFCTGWKATGRGTESRLICWAFDTIQDSQTDFCNQAFLEQTRMGAGWWRKNISPDLHCLFNYMVIYVSAVLTSCRIPFRRNIVLTYAYSNIEAKAEISKDRPVRFKTICSSLPHGSALKRNWAHKKRKRRKNFF